MKKNIFLIDDDKNILTSVSILLETEGFNVKTFSDGESGLEAILKNKSPISILRGKWINWGGRLVMPIFHPAYLLRNQSKEDGAPMSLTKSDFLKIKEKVDTLK